VEASVPTWLSIVIHEFLEAGIVCEALGGELVIEEDHVEGHVVAPILFEEVFADPEQLILDYVDALPLA